MIERYIDGPVAILHVEDHCVAAQLSPATDNAQSAVACRHYPRQIHRPHFKVARHWNRPFHDWRVQDSRNDHWLSRLQEDAAWLSIRLADSLRQLARSQI